MIVFNVNLFYIKLFRIVLKRSFAQELLFS